MKITVCQLHDDPGRFAADWEALVDHVQSAKSDLVLLPELPFCSWFATTQSFDPNVWQAVIDDHHAWMPCLPELGSTHVLGTRPVNDGETRLNVGFAWDGDAGCRDVHAKYYLPEEPGFWETAWYQRGEKVFTPVQCGPARVGFMICSELWFLEHARHYGQAGANIIAVPRATMKASLDRWMLAGRVAAIVGGAFCISSNRAGIHPAGITFAGRGWIISPDGDVLALTTDEAPFVTMEIDLQQAAEAKQTYPRNVAD